MKKHNKIIFSVVILFVILTFINIVYAIVVEDSSKFISGLLYNYLDNNTNVLIVSPKESNNLSYSNVESMFTNSYKKVKSIKDKNNKLLLKTESNIPTGATIITEENEEFKVIFYGDSNGDGIICSAQDVDVIKNDYLNRQKASGVYKISADLCVDNKLNVKDIQKMLLKKKGELNTGIVDKFPDEDSIHYATFMADNKEVDKIKFTVREGLLEDEPQVPEKPGYTGEWNEYDLIASDIIVEAKYTPIVYNITYETNGGTFAQSPKLTYTIEDENKTLPIPEKANYVFEGWYETADFTGSKVETTEGKLKNLTLYAKYEEAKYKNNLNKYYLTLKDAMDYANTKSTVTTIMPLVNVTETQAPIYKGTQNLTLNTNGKTITLSNVTLTNNKTLTISGSGTLTTSSAVDLITNTGTLNLTNTGTISNTNTEEYSTIKSTGTVNKTGSGTISSTAKRPTIYGGTIKISSGTVSTSGDQAINTTGTLTVTGGTISSTYGCAISARGNVTISGENTVIQKSAQQRGATFQYFGTGTATLLGGTIKTLSGTSGAVNNAGTGTVKISGATIQQLGNGHAIDNEAEGTIEITSGNITAEGGPGIYNMNAEGTIIVGTNESIPSVSTTVPSIRGKVEGVHVGTGTFNFYDGIIKGPSGKSISGTVTNIPKGYVIVKGAETIADTTYETSVLGPSAPVITAKLNNASGATYTSGTWTNQNVYVSLASSNVGAGIKEYQWYEKEEWVTRALTTTNNKGTITYQVNRNETLRFRAIDNNGVISEEVTLTVRIDKTLPTVTLGTNGGTYTILADLSNVNISTKLTASDTGGSELKSIEYAWSQSNSTEPTSYTVVANNATVTKTATGGNWYLWTKVLDNAGNRATSVKTSNVFTVKYQIAYDANGGSGAPSSQTKTHGTALTLSETVPTKAGYTFTGWATSKTATTAEYQPGDSYILNSAKKLYAVWSVNTATITIRKDGTNWSSSGMNVALYSGTTVKYAYSAGTASGATVKWTGVTAGTYNVYAGKSGTAKTTLKDTGIDITINETGIATATIDYYTLTRTQGTGTTLTIKETNASGTAITGTTQVLKNTVIHVTASANTGYNTLSLKVANTAFTSGNTKTITSATTVVTSATVNTYTISYDLAGGTAGTNAPTSGTYNADVQISNPTRTGYTFAGWTSTTANGLGANAKIGTTANPSTAWTGSATKNTYFRNLTNTNKGTVKLTATWTTNKYTVTYNANVFSAYNNTQNGLTFTYDASTSILTIDGKWTATSAFFGKIGGLDFALNDKYNIQLTYQSGSYTTTVSPVFSLDFQKDGSNYSNRVSGTHYKTLAYPTSGNATTSISIGSSTTDATGLNFWMWQNTAGATTFSNYKVKINVTKEKNQSIAYNSNYSGFPENPVRVGYTFKGWYTAETGGTAITTSTKMTKTSNHTIYAQWNINKLTIRYHVNGGILASIHGETIGISGNYVTVNNSTTIQTLNYGASLSTSGLADVNNTGYINIVRPGYRVVDKSELNTKVDGTGKSYDQKAVYSVSDFADLSDGSKTLDLYVNWTPVSYNLTYNLNGGSLSGQKTSYNITTANFTIPTPTKTGYTFNGWTEKIKNLTWLQGFVNYETGELEISTTYPDSYYTDFIRLRNGETYTLSGYGDYDTDGFRWRVYDTNGTFVSSNGGTNSYTATSDCYVRILYFKTSTEAQRTGTVITGSTNKSMIVSKGSTGNREYTATWTANTATVTIRKDGANWSGSGMNVALYSGTTAKYAYSAGTASGATVKWTGVTAGTYNVYAGKSGTAKTTLKDTGIDITVSATGTATIDYYTLTRTQGTGTTLTIKETNSSGTAITGTTQVLKNTVIYIAGSANTGYNTLSLKVADTAFTSGNTKTITSATTVVTSAVAKKVEVTFMRNTSTSDTTSAKQTFTYDVSDQSFSDKGWTRTGYTLAGWAFEKDATEEKYSVTSGVINAWINEYSPSTTLYAVWTPNTATVTIRKDGANWSGSGMNVALYSGTTVKYAYSSGTASGATVKWIGVANGTYNVYAGKNSGAKTTLIDTGLDITINNNDQTGTINYYSLTLAKGTGISDVKNGGTSTTSAVQYLYKNSGTQQDIAIDATVSSGYTWSTWTKSSGTTPATFTAGTKSQNIKLGAGAVTLTASTTYTATPTITRSDYNTFAYTATGAGAYYVSTSATAPSAGTTAASSTFALNTWTTAKNTGNLTLAENTTYYVYVKNAGTGGSVSTNKASIAVRKITRSQGTGTTLTTRYDATTETTGTALTESSILVLNGTPFWAKATANSGYRGIALKHGSTAITVAGGTFNASTSESIASTATANKVTITINKDGSGWSASGIRVDLYQSGTSKKNVTSSSGTTAVLSAVPNGTYDVYAGKNSGAKTTLIDTGLDITINNNDQTGTINYYSLTLAKGTGISDVKNGGTSTTSAVQYLYKNSGTQQDIAIDATASTGYTWSTWTKSSGTTPATFTAGTKSQNVKLGAGAVTLTASATANTYTISYDLAEGTAGTNAPTSGTYNKDVQVSNPTRTGYTFAGWTSTVGENAKSGTTANPSTEWTGSATKNTYFRNLTNTNKGTVKLTATWTANKYTVTYNANAFSAYNKTQNGLTFTYDATTSILTINGTWTSTVAHFGKIGGLDLALNDKYNIQLTYQSGSYTTTVSPAFVLDFQKDGSNYSNRVSGTHYKTLAYPKSGNATTSISIVSSTTDATGLNFWMWQSTAGETTFSNYKVKINVTKEKTQSIAYNSNYSGFPENPVRVGYTFKGWYTEETGGTQITTSTKMTKISNHTIYAQWNINRLTIRYHVNGGILASIHGETIGISGNYVTNNNSTSLHGLNYGQSLGSSGLVDVNNSGFINLSKPGYYIDSASALNTKADGTGKSYDQKAVYSVSDFADLSNGSKTLDLYVNWKANTYTISYDLDGGTAGTNKPTSGTYNKDVQISNPTKAGYTFAGWTSTVGSNAKSGTSANPTTAWTGTATKNTYFRNLTDTNNGTVKLTATWTANNYQNTNTSKYYSTLASAFSEVATGQTIKVLNSVTETTAPTIASGKTVTLNTNSKTTTLNDVYITNNGILTINGSGKIISTGTGISNNGTGRLTVSSVTIETTGVSIRNNSSANTEAQPAVKINSGTITSKTSNTIANSSNVTGWIVIAGGTINSEQTEGRPTVINYKGKIIISGGKINSVNNRAVLQYQEDDGIIEVRAGTITGVDGIVVNAGEMIIKGGTITGTNNGVSVSGTGKLTLGTHETTPSVSKTNPNITGSKYGVSVSSTGTFNFYDGIIKGTTNAISGNITATQTNYGVKYGTADSKKAAWLEPAVCRIGNVYYLDIKDAVDAVGTSQTTIVMLQSLSNDLRGAYEIVKIPEGKNVILDMNNYSFTRTQCAESVTAVIVNEGTLTVKNGSIRAEAPNSTFTIAPCIYSPGTLTVNNMILSAEGSAIGLGTTGTLNYTSTTCNIDESSARKAIIGGKTMTINSGTINSHGISCDGTLNIYGGTVNDDIVADIITLGKNDNTISTTSPVINGRVDANDTLNMYDGIITTEIGVNPVVLENTIVNTPTSAYHIVVTPGETTNTAVLSNSHVVARAGQNYYTTLQNAINGCGIDSLDIYLLENLNTTVKIPEDKYSAINLNGKTISADGNIFENSGTLILKGTGTLNQTGTTGSCISTTGRFMSESNIIYNSNNYGISMSGSDSSVSLTAGTINAEKNGIYDSGSGSVSLGKTVSVKSNTAIGVLTKGITISGNARIEGKTYGVHGVTGKVTVIDSPTIISHGSAGIYVTSGEIDIAGIGNKYLDTETKGATIECASTSGYGLLTTTGVITLGKQDLSVNTNLPIIRSNYRGIGITSSTGILNYYDGVIYGKTEAIYCVGTQNLEPNYVISTSTATTTIGGTSVSCKKAVLSYSSSTASISEEPGEMYNTDIIEEQQILTMQNSVITEQIELPTITSGIEPPKNANKEDEKSTDDSNLKQETDISDEVSKDQIEDKDNSEKNVDNNNEEKDNQEIIDKKADLEDDSNVKGNEKDNEQDLDNKDKNSTVNSSDDILEKDLTDYNVINQELNLLNKEERIIEEQSITTYNILEKDIKEETE